MRLLYTDEVNGGYYERYQELREFLTQSGLGEIDQRQECVG